ncbi:MAG: hypothetical protein AB3N28_04300 [Kordiimonas sp.]
MDNYYVRREIFPEQPVGFVSCEMLLQKLEDCYQKVHKCISSDWSEISAWKLGGTNAATQKAFNVEELYFGPLSKTQVYHEGECLHSSVRLFSLQAEPEICLRLSRDMGPGVDFEDYTALFSSWSWGLEYPNTSIENMVKAGVQALVLDHCAAGLLCVGTEKPISDLQALDRNDSVELETRAQVISEGSVGNLLSPPIQTAADFLRLATKLGFEFREGQYIATGGLAPCKVIAPDQDVVLRVNGREELRMSLPSRALVDA